MNISKLFQSYVRGMPLIGGMYNTAEVVSNLFGKDNEFDSASDNVFNQLAKGADNYLRSALHTGLTDEELQRNALMRENRQTEMSDAVKGLEAAGLNAGLVYGSSPSVGNPQSSPGISGPGLGELLQLAMLPAQIRRTNAEAGLIEQQTSTEEQETKLKTILAAYQSDVSDATIKQLLADVAQKYAGAELASSQKDYVSTQADAQKILNEHLDEKTIAEIDNIRASSSKLSAEAAKVKAEEVYQKWVNEYIDKWKCLPSSNDALVIGSYLLDLFGGQISDVSSILDPNKIPVVAAYNKFKEYREYKKSHPHRGGSR